MRRHLTVAALTSIAVLVSAGASARLTRTTGQHPSPAPMTTATSSTIPAELAARDSRPTAPEPAAPAGQGSPLESDEIVLVDDSRPAPDRDQRPAGEYRRLRTEIRRPADAFGRAPLIVFAHGYDSEPETYEPLIGAWASAGYVVAAPELPGSARDLPGPPQRDIADQAPDLSPAAAALLHRYPPLIHPARIVAPGHS